MSVHKKLMQARMLLQSVKIKKSGVNKFPGYEYFELSDFIPDVQRIFHELGLCGVVSYCRDLATLTITDTETSQSIKITSPMAGANLKGCHDIQNLGAVETYQRRYLWVTAMEILEHDAIDSTSGSNGSDIERITADQATDLLDKIKESGLKLETFYAKFNIKQLPSLPALEYKNALDKIDQFRRQREAKNAAKV